MPEETTQTPEAPVEETPVETAEVEETPVAEEAPPVVEPHDIVEEEPAINQIEMLAMEEPEPEPEPEAVEPEDPLAGEPQFTNNQFALANALGMSVEDVKAFGDPEAFDRVIGGIANRALHARQQSQAQQQQQQAAGNEQAGQPEAVSDFTFEEPDDYDDGVLKLNDNTNKRFQQMESRMNAVMQQNQALMQQHQLVQQDIASRELDTIFNSMDEKIFGRGRLNDVPEDVGSNRIQVANEAARLGQVHSQGGGQMPSLSELAQRAANSLFGEKFTQNALEEASQRSRKIAGQSSAVPTRQEDTSDRGYEAAVRAAANWQRENLGSDDISSAFPN